MIRGGDRGILKIDNTQEDKLSFQKDMGTKYHFRKPEGKILLEEGPTQKMDRSMLFKKG